jgi:hypothetical protein
MLDPVVVKVATKAVTVVLLGTMIAMVFALSSIVPVAAGEAKEKAVIALALEVVPVPVSGLVGLEQAARSRAAVVRMPNRNGFFFIVSSTNEWPEVYHSPREEAS